MGGGVAPLLDRLGNRLGLAALCCIAGRESHIPERASVRVPAASPSPPSLRSGPSPAVRERGDPAYRAGWVRERRGREGLIGRGRRQTAASDPAVRAAGTGRGGVAAARRPARSLFTWRRRAHRVKRADEQERVAEEWWPPAGSAATDAIRDYYRVEDGEGRRFWLFRAGMPGGGHPPHWYVHGVFA